MGKATFNPILELANRVPVVKIRIIKNRIPREYTTNITLKKSDWNDKATERLKNWVRTSHRDHDDLNDEIKALLKKFRKIEKDNPTYTSTQLRDAYGQAETKGSGFIAFAKEWIRRKEALGQNGTATVYQSALFYFTEFWGKRPDAAEQLTPGNISKLVQHLRTVKVSEVKTGYEPSTINLAFKNYRTIFKNAVLEGWLPPMPNPFDVPPQTEEEKPLDYPTVQELLSLMDLEGLTPVQTHARNIFLMQYFLNGARISEVIQLERKALKGDRVDYQPVKRSTRTKSIPRHEGVEWVLSQYPEESKYLFPYLQPEDDKLTGQERVRLLQKLVTGINKALKIVGRKAGIQAKLTTHVQRHVFAEKVWDLRKNIRDVQEMLGHQSFQTSETYLMKRLNLKEKNSLQDALYGSIKKPGKQ